MSSKFLTVVIVPFFFQAKIICWQQRLWDRPRLPHHHQGLRRQSTTIVTTVTLTEEPDYTSVFVSVGHTITVIVSHVTTTNDIGQTVTTTVTVMSYDQVGDGV